MSTYDDTFSGYHRVAEIDPYRPARTELVGDNTGQASSKDVGKFVKLSGETVVPCADGDEIYGVIESMNAATHNGHSVGGVLSDSGNQAYALDEDGGLAVGDLVVAGTPVALGTALTTYANVIVAPAEAAGVHRWIVVAAYGSGAGSRVLIRKI